MVAKLGTNISSSGKGDSKDSMTRVRCASGNVCDSDIGAARTLRDVLNSHLVSHLLFNSTCRRPDKRRK